MMDWKPSLSEGRETVLFEWYDLRRNDTIHHIPIPLDIEIQRLCCDDTTQFHNSYFPLQPIHIPIGSFSFVF